MRGEGGRKGGDVMTLHFIYRLLKTRVLRAWWRFVPLSHEEKAREVRRAKLRRKVAQWLPDYQPGTVDATHVEEEEEEEEEKEEGRR